MLLIVKTHFLILRLLSMIRFYARIWGQTMAHEVRNTLKSKEVYFYHYFVIAKNILPIFLLLIDCSDFR